jgi:hypothetical protein
MTGLEKLGIAFCVIAIVNQGVMRTALGENLCVVLALVGIALFLLCGDRRKP